MSALVGHCPACGRQSLFQGMGGHITCGHLECPRPTAVDELLQDDEREHIVYFEEHSFVIRHPLRERLQDELVQCVLTEHIASLPEPPVEPGRYRAMAMIGGLWKWEPA